MKILYHYCSNDAFLSIIESRTFRASEFTLSNDALEGKWIRKVVEQCCDEKNISYFDKLAILQHLDGLTSYLGAVGICLSEKGDLLSQWRAYSNDGSGVAIGLDHSCFGVEGSPLPSLQKVEYEPNIQKKIIEDNMRTIFTLVEKGACREPTLIGSANSNAKEEFEANKRDLLVAIYGLFPILYKFKNPAFSEEIEWRSITIAVPGNDLVGNRNEGAGVNLDKLKFRALSDRIVPYQEFPLETQLNQSVIREIVLGPKNITPVRIVEAALRRYGWTGVKVWKSAASYR